MEQKNHENKERTVSGYIIYRLACIVFVALFVSVMLFMVSGLPEFASQQGPVSSEVSYKYLKDTVADTGAVNAVAGMILDYRAFDTLGETCVLYAALICVLLLLGHTRLKYSKAAAGYMPGRIDLSRESNPLKDDDILKVSMRVLFPVIVLYGICVVMNGHISPGGGFSGGAVLSGAFILYANAYGEEAAEKIIGRKLYTALTAGAIGCYCLIKSAAFFMGANGIEDPFPKGIPGTLISGGVIPLLNICIGIVVACTVYGIFLLFMKGGFRE